MKSPFRYPGGKSRKNIQQNILSCAPKQINEYREPFVGGGGIFFALDGLTRNIPQNRWINDINIDLISVYLALRDNSETFIKQCKSIKPPINGELEVYPKISSNGKKYNARLKQEFDRLISDRTNSALSYFFINRTVWGGRVNYDMPSRLYFSNPNGWNIVKTNLLEKASVLLNNVKITTGDYCDLLVQEGKDVWIYCDPPYISNTLFSNGSKLYKNNFDLEDHVKLCEYIKNCKHKVCLSYDDNPIIRDLYSSFNIYASEWIYCGTSLNNKKRGKELIITNYSTKKKYTLVNFV